MAEDDLDDGLEEAFTMIEQYTDEPISGQWVSNECFVFINKKGNINYLIEGRVMKLGSSGKKQYILGYDSKQNRLYLVDKALNVYAHRLLMSVLNFQAAIMNGETDKALSLKASIPDSQHGKLAKFLENNGQK
jgi:coatomer subunit beta'